MKKIVMLLVFLMVLACSATVFADYQTVEVYVNGELLLSDSPAVLVGSRTMVPLRAISEKLGCTVGWNNETQTAEIKNSNTAVYVTIDSDVMVKQDLALNKSEEIKIDAPAMLYKERTLIPLRAVSEALNAKVDWDSEKECALITVETYESYYGIVTENGYVSEELGIKFTAPVGVQLLYNADKIEVAERAEDVEAVDAQSVAEFSAYYVDTGSNLSFAVSPKTNVTAKEYLEYVRPYIAGTSNGITYVAAQDTEKLEIAGYEFEKIELVAMYNDTRLNMDYCAGRINDRLVIAVVVYMDGAEINKYELISAFTQIK